MEEMDHDFIYELIREKFEFLVKDHGFSGPYKAFGGLVSKIWYSAEKLAIEFTLDRHDQAINFYFSRLDNGKRPEGYSHNKEGLRIRYRTPTWIWEKEGQETKLFNKVTGLPMNEQIKSQISDYANMLKLYGQRILDDDVSIFDEEIPGDRGYF